MFRRKGAVLLTLGVLAVGLSACGSDSSSGTKKSTSPVAKKEAGVLHVQLTVVNKTGSARYVELCDESSCASHGDMKNDGSATATSGSYHLPAGKIDYPDGSIVYFVSANPAIGEPFVRVSSDRLGNDNAHIVSLSEGETTSVGVRDHAFDLERAGDTDYKVMTLTAR